MTSDAKARKGASRLFSLFAQNHQSADQMTVKLNWNTFCEDTLFRDDDSALLSTWQRFTKQIIKHHRLKVVPASTASMPLFNGKFKKSFNVAMALTVRALTIKGVSPANIAKTQLSLCEQQLQLQKAKTRQIDTPAAEPKSLPPSKIHGRDSVAPVRHTRSIDSLRAGSRKGPKEGRLIQSTLVDEGFALQTKMGIRLHDCDTLKDIAMFSASTANVKTSAAKTPRIAWRHARSTIVSESRTSSTELSPSRPNDMFLRTSSAPNDFNCTRSSNSAESTQSLGKASGRRLSRR